MRSSPSNFSTSQMTSPVDGGAHGAALEESRQPGFTMLGGEAVRDLFCGAEICLDISLSKSRFCNFGRRFFKTFSPGSRPGGKPAAGHQDIAQVAAGPPAATDAPPPSSRGLFAAVEATPPVFRQIFSQFQDVANTEGRLPPAKHTAKADFAKLEREGIIRRSSSTWSAPLHMVMKPDGTWRPCGDYRRLNLVTTPDSYPLPNIQDLSARRTCRRGSTAAPSSVSWISAKVITRYLYRREIYTRQQSSPPSAYGSSCACRLGCATPGSPSSGLWTRS